MCCISHIALIQHRSHECRNPCDAGPQLAPAHPSASGEACISPRQDLAAAAEPRRGRGQERGACAADEEETQEDFEWLMREIVEGGGEAVVCEARLIDGISDQDVRALFERARDADYEEVAKNARALAKSLRRNAKAETLAERRTQVARLRK